MLLIGAAAAGACFEALAHDLMPPDATFPHPPRGDQSMKDATSPGGLKVLTRSTQNRPDDSSQPQIKVWYVLPSDGPDEGLDTNGAISRSVAVGLEWVRVQTGGRTFRMDTFNGDLDIGFFRMARTDAQLAATGALVRDAIEAAMDAAGLTRANRLDLVYYGGTNTTACASGAYPPVLVGSVGALYLKGNVPGFVPCGENELAPSESAPPGYWEFSWVHEMMHVMGFVASCAPHHTMAGHVSDSPIDLMYAGSQPWQPSVLDVNHDDYFSHNRADCADLARAPYLKLDEAGGALLSALPAQQVDTSYRSTTNTAAARISFQNYCPYAVDLYWIDYSGNRILYASLPGPGGTRLQDTFLGHPWLIVRSGTGGTQVQGTGTLVGAFSASTALSGSSGWDTAEICDSLRPDLVVTLPNPSPPTAAVGQSTGPIKVRVAQAGTIGVGIIGIASDNPQEFRIAASTCAGNLVPGAACDVDVNFAPIAVGTRSAFITVTSSDRGSPHRILVSGDGVPATPSVVDAVEYFHASFQHYFITSLPAEINALDAGQFSGWVRTGQTFKLWPAASAGLSPICRFFSAVFAPKSSHFYTPYPSECATVQNNPDWQYEGVVAYAVLPSNAGTCPSGIPLYRLYNDGQGGAPNHRYTTSTAVRSSMVAQGWVPEGAGTVGVIACVPSQ